MSAAAASSGSFTAGSSSSSSSTNRAGGTRSAGKTPEYHHSFDDLFQAELASSTERLRKADVAKLIVAASKAASGDSSTLAALQRQHMTRSIGASRLHLERLWEEFDLDRNGLLSKYEAKRLITQYFLACRKWSPVIVDQTLKSGVDLGLRIVAEVCGGTVPEDVANTVTIHMKDLAPQLEELTNKVLDQLQQGDISDSVLEKMDMDGDGKVDQQEFVANFLPVMSQLFDPQAMITPILMSLGLPL